MAEAKNRFSELITRTLREGPQRVRRRDQEVVLLSSEDYLRLSGQQAEAFKAHLLSFPGFGDERHAAAALERQPSAGRDVAL